MICRAHLALTLALCIAPGGGVLKALAQGTPTTTRLITLEESIQTALLNNRALQIQRLNPEIARNTLSASGGYYDPLFSADVRRDSKSDSGGFDPVDYSRDAIYQAESETAQVGITGVLPTGLRYVLGGSYANSHGNRNFTDFDSYNLFAGVTVQQPLLKNFWIDQGRMTIQVNKKNLTITELGVSYLTMDIINQVQRAYYDLLAARDNLKALTGLVKTRETFVAGVQRQVAVGMMTPPDADLAQSQLAIAQAEALSASNLVTLAENSLKSLLGEMVTNLAAVRLAPREHLIVVPETFDLSLSWSHAVRDRPDLAQLRQDLQKAEIDVKYRKNQLFPSLDLVAGYSRRGASTMQAIGGSGGGTVVLPGVVSHEAEASFTDAMNQIRRGDNPSDMLGVIFSLPLSRTVERANYRVSKQLKAQAELVVKQKEELVMREIADAISTARTDQERVHVTRRAAQFAESALAAEERKLAGGKSTVFFVVQLQRDLATAQVAEIRAKADYNKAVSQLHFADGSLLETKRITLEYQ